MTKHMDFQPDRCLQCLKIGLTLTHGRCNTCRNRTSAAVWNEYHGPAGVRVDLRRAPKADASFVSRLVPLEEAQAMLDEIEGKIARAQIRRVEQISDRCTMERYSDLDTGACVQRVTLLTTEEV